MRLTIVRHCKTLLNEENKLQGVTDLKLSEGGMAQARKLAARLKNEKIDAVYTSRMKRAIQTAEFINKFHNVPLIKEKTLNEMSYGIFERMTASQVKEEYPDLYKEWSMDAFNFRFPQGESLSDVKSRIKNFTDRVLNQKKDLMIVSHGEVSRVMLGCILNWSDEKVASSRLSNGSVTMLETGKIPKLLVFNS